MHAGSHAFGGRWWERFANPFSWQRPRDFLSSICPSITPRVPYHSSPSIPSGFLLLSFLFFPGAFISINLLRGPSVIRLPSREVFPEGKLLWRPAWPRAASDWPSACLPFCILHCLFNKEQSECDFQGRVPVIVALTPCLSNDPHYGASDSSLKGLIYEYAGTAAPQASTHQPPSMLSPPSVSAHRLYIHVRGRSRTCSTFTCTRWQMAYAHKIHRWVLESS